MSHVNCSFTEKKVAVSKYERLLFIAVRNTIEKLIGSQLVSSEGGLLT